MAARIQPSPRSSLRATLATRWAPSSVTFGPRTSAPTACTPTSAAVVPLGNCLVEHDLPTDVAAIKREHIQNWQINLL